MSGFADAIARLSNEHFETPLADEWTCAEAILAMPEMQAIKRTILSLTDLGASDDESRARLAALNVPESIVEWVLS